MIHLPMFDQFVLITLQVLVPYSLAHLKLHSYLQPLKLHLRLWIHLHVSPQNYQILLILVILHHLLPLASIHCLFELSSYKEAILDPLWQQAMDEELSALHKTDTWDLVPLPPGKSIVGCRWVYKIKTNSDGSIERYKTRLVAKGCKRILSIVWCVL